MIIPTRMDAVRGLVDGTFTFQSDGVIVYHDGQIAPSESAIQAKLAELQAAEPLRLLRVERDRLLAECDWWASSDLTMSAKRKSYRQALRDLPASASPAIDESGQLTGVTWPTKPA